MTSRPKRAYSYLRFSKSSQAEGDSIRRQSDYTRRYCEERGLVLDQSLNLEDRGVSAWRGRNVRDGALGRFISACEAGVIPRGSALIVENIDRLSRQSPRKTVTLLSRLLDDFGLEVHLTMLGKVFRPDQGEDEGIDLILAVAMAMRAHDESEAKSKRLREAFAQKRLAAARGETILSKSLPWFLTLKKSKVVCPPDRASVVKKIFQLTARGHSSNQIARILNSKKTPTWRPKQLEWSAARVRDLVRSDSPLGTLRQTPKIALEGRTHEVHSYYPKIISEDLAIEARAVLQRNTRGNRGRIARNPERPVNLLRGLARYRGDWMTFACHRNGPVDPKTNNRSFNAYYTCRDELKGKILFNMASTQVEGVLLLGLAELTPEDLTPLQEESVVPRSSIIQSKIDRLDAKIANLLTAIESGSTSVASRLRQIETERQTLSTQLNAAQAEEATPSASPQALEEIQSISLSLLHEPHTREKIATHLRRIITRIDIGRTIKDLPLTDKFQGNLVKSLARGGINLIPDTTSRARPRKPLALLVHFAGGASRLILRGLSHTDAITTHRAENT